MHKFGKADFAYMLQLERTAEGFCTVCPTSARHLHIVEYVDDRDDTD
jgi:hypothetical protein